MKSFYHLITAALLTLPAAAEIIGVESFDYLDGSLAGKNGGTFWNFKNTVPAGRSGTASAWSNLSGAPAVTAGQLVTSSNGAVRRAYNGDTESTGAINDANVANTVFYKVNVTTGPSVAAGDYFGISSMEGTTERFYFGKRGVGTNWGVEQVGVGGANGGANILPDTTYTLVTQIDLPNDRIRLYVDPNLGIAQSANTLTVSQAYTGAAASTAVRFAAGTAVRWDNLVIATTWEDLSPPTVVTTSADEDDGANSLNTPADISLREAVKYSPTGSLITFAPLFSGSTFTLTHLDGDMEIPGALTIDATALAAGLTVSGNTTTRHFHIQNGKSLTLRGLTLTRGMGSSSIPFGGGSIYSEGTLRLFRCTLTENAVPAVNNPFGGALFLRGGSLQAEDCTFADNAAGTGGAVSLLDCASQFIRCTFTGNTAQMGGAIDMNNQNGTTLSLTNCTIAGNRCFGSASAGGIHAVFGTLNLQHCTISDNTGTRAGALLSDSTSATVNIGNSIIAGNLTSTGFNAELATLGGTFSASGTNFIGNNHGVESTFPSGPLIGTAGSQADPQLSALGHFGGHVMTMHPLQFSPVIEAGASVDPGGTDARGFSRFQDGAPDLINVVKLDIGAVEAGTLHTVTSAADDGGSGTLRSTINAASSQPGARIRFSPGLPTITLAQGELAIPATPGLFIEGATDLGITISGDSSNPSRIFNIPPTATVAMHSLKITNGNVPDGLFGDGITSAATASSDGGGIRNAGKLSLMRCTIAENFAGDGGSRDGSSTPIAISGGSGGGIFSSGPLTLTACTVSGNSAGLGGSAEVTNGEPGSGGSGGGIHCTGPLILTACTFSGNTAGDGGQGGNSSGSGGNGGGVSSIGPLTLSASTISENRAGRGATATLKTTTGIGGNGGSGGGISRNSRVPYTIIACTIAANRAGTGGSGTISTGPTGNGGGIFHGQPSPSPWRLSNSIVANNTAAAGRDIHTPTGTLTPIGRNLVTNVAGSTLTAGQTTINADPKLAPLADYGGLTQTMALRPGSPAINTTVVLTARYTDQRGLAPISQPDLGAHERGHGSLDNFNVWLWEIHDNAIGSPTDDLDGDGANTTLEWLAQTNPTNPNSAFRLDFNGNNGVISFPTVSTRTYTLQHSDTLAPESWVDSGFSLFGDGNLSQFAPSFPTPGVPRRFYRLAVSP